MYVELVHQVHYTLNMLSIEWCNTILYFTLLYITFVNNSIFTFIQISVKKNNNYYYGESRLSVHQEITKFIETIVPEESVSHAFHPR